MSRTAIFVACAGRMSAGPETYERHLVQAIARVDRENPYDVYCFSREARRALNVNQPNFRMHTFNLTFRQFRFVNDFYSTIFSRFFMCSNYNN